MFLYDITHAPGARYESKHYLIGRGFKETGHEIEFKYLEEMDNSVSKYVGVSIVFFITLQMNL
jgi:hypothetical protein